MVWERFSLKDGERLVCHSCKEVIHGEDLHIRGGGIDCVYIDIDEEIIHACLINKSIICRECLDRNGKPKTKPIWGLM